MSKLQEKLSKGEFVVTGEVGPPKGVDLEEMERSGSSPAEYYRVNSKGEYCRVHKASFVNHCEVDLPAAVRVCDARERYNSCCIIYADREHARIVHLVHYF